MARFDGLVWHPIGSAGTNFVWDISVREDQSGILVGGPFLNFNGVHTGTTFVWDCMFDPDAPCDPTGDGVVDVDDMLLALDQFGFCPGCEADLDDNYFVNVNDILAIIGLWGVCP